MTDDPLTSLTEPSTPSVVEGIGSLGDLLERNARDRPAATGITDGSVRLDWGKYRDAAARLAGALGAAGVAPGDRVAVHMPKSVDSFVAVHAILRLGGVVVPVDWFAPTDYIRHLLDDAEPAAVVSTANESVLDEMLGRPPRIPVVAPGDDGPIASPRPVAPSDDAYIVYTSGSTGRPKGIVHTHGSALAYARAAANAYSITDEDRLVNVAPLHFDQSTFELYAAPLAGAAVIVMSDVMLRFPASASQLIAAERATVWYSVPYAITKLATRGVLEERDLSPMRWVLFGGESFQPGALAAAMRALPGVRFSNVYGPAEVNQCTLFHLDEPPSGDDQIPIGRAWDAAELRIMSDDGSTLSGAGTGELFVAGPTMMSRYWNRPDLTEAAIESVEGRRWYRTGDLVTRRPDGDIVFIGRVDHQIKLRGHRIELEAVEATACEHPAVADCAVVVERADDDGGHHRDGVAPGGVGAVGEDRLVALVAPGPDPATTEEVHGLLRDRLPRYAVPAEIVGVPSIPRSRTGKIDRPAAAGELARLREIGHGSDAAGSEHR